MKEKLKDFRRSIESVIITTIGLLLHISVVAAIMSIAVYFLWNWLITEHPITWFESWGVSALSRLLFGNRGTGKK